ncbi:MAG: pyridoxamine 5'-phosphate oxidase [Geminicoccaceae bacterium]
MNDTRAMRRDYRQGELTEAAASSDPIAQFRRWFEEAQTLGSIEANAMTLATVGAYGQPSARTVLLKDFGEAGFSFFTNYESRKAEDLEANPKAALLFLWQPQERQVRLEGQVSKLDQAASDAYFAERPRGSQLGAWASPQSRPLANRDELERNLADVEARFGDDPIPRPSFWGGYLLQPRLIEFWQGRTSRLHDRLLFTRDETGWRRQRLAP